MYVATATDPAGPYTWAADATVMDQDATLSDPSIFADPQTGKVWLTYTWHRDYPSWTLQNELRAVELNPAGLTTIRTGATPTLLLSTAIDPQPRERPTTPPQQAGQRPATFPDRFPDATVLE